MKKLKRKNNYRFTLNVAGVTGLEPAASCVTGRRSNQAELHPRFFLVGGERLELPTLSV